eukprot:SAG11_NODE_248_length_11654_cov_27.840329_5_plen_46_part_00
MIRHPLVAKNSRQYLLADQFLIGIFNINYYKTSYRVIFDRQYWYG